MLEAFLAETEVEVLAVTRHPDALGATMEDWGNRVRVLAADICSDEGRKAVAREVGQMPPLQVIIHNAGALVYRPFAQTTESDLTHIYKVNVFAPYLLTQALLPHMKSTHVINISSVGGVEGSLKFAGLSAYSSSKAALNCLTEMWSEEFKETDIVFNCLALGSVETDMFKEAFPGVPAASSPQNMARFIVSFAFDAPQVMRGKIISLSLGNP